MKNEEVIRILQSLPKDMEVSMYQGCMYAPIGEIEVKRLWVEREPKEVITIYPKRRIK